MRRMLRATLAALLLCVTPAIAQDSTETARPAADGKYPSATDDKGSFPAQMIYEYCHSIDQLVAENLDGQEGETRTSFMLGSAYEYRMTNGLGQKILEQIVNGYTKGGLCVNTIVSSSPLCGIQQTARVRQTLDIALQKGWSEADEETPIDGEIRVFQAGEDLTDIQDPSLVSSATRFWTPPGILDRTYITLVFSRHGGRVESLVELPWTTTCYLVRDGFVNDDEFTDLVFYDPSLISDGRPLMKPVCGDGAGEFSARRCGSPRVPPPHLRITHPGPYD